MAENVPNQAASKPYIGGQAVIEGVMMRSQQTIGVAVRRPDGSIAVDRYPTPSWANKTKWPFARGVVMLVEAMKIGYRALHFSAEQQMTEDEKQQKSQQSTSLPMVVSVFLAVALFMALPQGLASGLSQWFGWNLHVQDSRFHALVGLFKLGVLLGYMLVIRSLKDVRRVFQYHGAEHKTIYAYEQGLPLEIAHAAAQSTLHPRCGTTFLVVVVLISIVVGAAVTPLVLPHAQGLVGQLATLGLRLLLLPIIAGIAYELQKISAKYCTQGWMRVFLLPGFLFQKITTIEPDASQLELALAAMRVAIKPAERHTVEVFRDYLSVAEAYPV